jgi:hypothetical protein
MRIILKKRKRTHIKWMLDALKLHVVLVLGYMNEEVVYTTETVYQEFCGTLMTSDCPKSKYKNTRKHRVVGGFEII